MVCEVMLWTVRTYVAKKFCCTDQTTGNLTNLKVDASAIIYLLVDIRIPVVKIFHYISKCLPVHNLAEVCFEVTVHIATTAPSIFSYRYYSVTTPLWKNGNCVKMQYTKTKKEA